MPDHEDYLSGEAPSAHKASHENGGSDEISVAGLSGELADDQPPKAHDLGGAKHNADTLADLNTKVSDATLDDSGDPRTPSAHKASHENGGSDEISVAGLSGELADDQPPKAHYLGGAKHNADTLANLNIKVSDATLEDKTVLETTMDGKIATHAALEDVHHDYEEGTWTPVLVNFTPSAPICYTVTGHYTKTGQLVHIECKVDIDAGETLAATINIANITGLPFAVSQSSIGVQGSISSWSGGYHGFVLFYTDEKIWVETFPAQASTILINGFYRTAA